jgi:cathepsin A (carboxypeptidase C)
MRLHLCVILALIGGISAQLFLDEQYETGYVHVGRTDSPLELFYMLFKSRDRNPMAPLVWFFEGGPGRSGLHAVFYQNGPYRLNADFTLRKNEYSYNNLADVMYIDQPIGTGFSNCSNSSLIPNHESIIVEDLVSFLHNFFDTHPDYRNRPLYLVSHGYGSHFVLPLAKALVSNRVRHVNIQGLAMDNPWIRPELQITSLAAFSKRRNLTSEFHYIAGLYGLIISSVFVDLDMDTYAFDAMNLARGIMVGSINHKFNREDIRIKCHSGPCVYNWTHLGEFLNRPDVKRILNVGDRHFNLSDPVVFQHLVFHNEFFSDKSNSLIDILDQSSLPVYIMAGVENWNVNVFGLDAFVDSLHWSGRVPFKSQFWREWYTDGFFRARYKKYKNFFYVHVLDAGDYIAMDQPGFALDVLSRLTFGSN